jgi:hypothetical protein
MIFNEHSTITVRKGDRIAQLICEKIEMADLIEEQVNETTNNTIVTGCIVDVIYDEYCRNSMKLFVVRMVSAVVVAFVILPMDMIVRSNVIFKQV